MSKQVKQMVVEELSRRLAGIDSCLLVDPTRLDGQTANQLRRQMSQAGVRMLLVKNSLARRALAGGELAPLADLLEGTCAIAWGGESVVDVAKLLAGKLKEMPNLLVKGAVMEGQALDAAAAAALSKLPSRSEMRGILVGTAMGPGRRVAGAVLAAGARIASLLKGRIESLEKSAGPVAA